MKISPCIAAAVCCYTLHCVAEQAPLAVADGYQAEILVPGSPFCGVHGLAVNAAGELFAGSVVGERIYQVDIKSGAVNVSIKPPVGMADDIEFLPDGTMVWTSISQNAVRAQSPDGSVRTLAELTSVNALAYRDSDGKLFVSQVFGGDGLWDVDPRGNRPPKLILKDLGGLNGFDIGPDGHIYGPLWFKQQVVKINPDTGELRIIAEGFHTPAAANFDSHWNLYVLDTALGEVVKVDIESGEKTVFAQLKTSLDNLAIDNKNTLYVSNMADNSIQSISPTGEMQSVIKGGLSCPVGISVVEEQLYVADIFALRKVELSTGKVHDLERSHAANTSIAYPTAVAASANFLYVMSSGELQQYRRSDHQLLQTWSDNPAIQSIAELPNGDVLALSSGTKVTRHNRDKLAQFTLVTDQLPRSAAIVTSKGGRVFISLPEQNAIAELDLNTGKHRILFDQLRAPRGMALANNGDLIVMEGHGRVVRANLTTGKTMELIRNIPVGNITAGETQAPGVGVDRHGHIYVLADQHNAIYKISAK